MSLATGIPIAQAYEPQDDTPPAACSAASLSATQVWEGASGGSQGSYVLVTNVDSQPCVVTGYPDITGAHDAGHSPIAIDVSDGSTYMKPDPGPVSTILDPGYSVSFFLGSGVGYGTGEVHIASVDLQFASASTLSVPITLAAEPATVGDPVPVGVTAFEPDAAACGSSDLSVSIAQHGVIDDYSTALVELENTTTEPCSVYGYPAVTLYGGAHTALPIDVAYGDTYIMSDPGPTIVVLAPGAAAEYAMSTYVGYGTSDLDVFKVFTTIYLSPGADPAATILHYQIPLWMYGQIAPGQTTFTVNVTALAPAP